VPEDDFTLNVFLTKVMLFQCDTPLCLTIPIVPRESYLFPSDPAEHHTKEVPCIEDTSTTLLRDTFLKMMSRSIPEYTEISGKTFSEFTEL